MSNFLFVIDGYLSNYQRVSVCDELITQLKTFFPNRKILLLNKFNNSFGLESKVDYYFYYGDGFMVGEPPNEIIKNEKYCRPYVYFETSTGVLENWMPHVGVSDHVANVYNGFLISSMIAKNLGFEKVFRIEYDMLFDENEIKLLQSHLEKFDNEDYLIYGRRKEGSWIADYLSLIDLHFCGFSNKMFEGFDLVKNDEDYWNLCEKVKYWGKWCEYLLSMVFETNLKKMVGTEHIDSVRRFFSDSFFDRISSSGLWENKWTDVPRICRISRDGGVTESEDEVLLFYWNNDCNKMDYKVSTNFDYQKQGTLSEGMWSYEILKIQDGAKFDCTVYRDSKLHNFTIKLNREDINKLNNRFLFK